MAFFKGSYYENVPLFEPDDAGRTVFGGLRARPLARPEPVLEHSVALKERLDSVAYHYYAEPRDWRRIAEANPDAVFSSTCCGIPSRSRRTAASASATSC